MKGQPKIYIKHRAAWLVVALDLVTMGFYGLYWLTVTGRQLKQATGEDLPDFLKVILYPLVGFYIAFLTGVSLDSRPGGQTAITTTIVLMALVGLLVWTAYTFYWYWLYSRAAARYLNGKASPIKLFLLLALINLFGFAYAQHQFNKIQPRNHHYK